MTPIKRLNYFKGQFLKADDFIDEQEYHVRMRRLHNSSMHTWGVVAGLEVVADATGVKVAPGSAIDKEGKEIRLLNETRVTNPAGNGDHYIVVSYKDVLDTPYPAEENKYIRWLETGELSWVAASPPPANDADLLKLARVTVSGGKVTQQMGPPPNPDNSVRRTASSLRANSNGDLEICPVSKGGGIGISVPDGKLEIKGKVASVKFGGVNGDVHHLSCVRDFVFNSEQGHFLFRKTAYTDLSDFKELVTITPEGALLVKGKIVSGGALGVGAPIPEHALTVQGSGATYLNVKGSDGAVEVLVGADQGGGVVSARTNHDLQLKAGNNTTRMIIKANGNVGIGTTAPDTNCKLDVDGAVKATRFQGAGGSITGIDAGNISTGTLSLERIPNLPADRVTGQWIKRGTDLYYDGGNVGVGLTDPKNKLEISGQLCVRGERSSLVFADENGNVYRDNWIGMTRNIDGNTKWLHIGGISSPGETGKEERRLTLQAGITHVKGRLGIGTPRPKTDLVIFNEAHKAVGPVLTLQNNGGNEGAGGAIDFNGYNVGDEDATARIRSFDDDNGSSHLIFYTKDTVPPSKRPFPLKERLRITATGEVKVAGSISCGGKVGFKTHHGTYISARSPEPKQEENNRVYCKDGCGSYESFTIEVACSRELKENISDISGAEAMTTLGALNPIKYDYKGERAFRQNLGFIAEEMPPNLASEDRKTISPFEVIPILTRVAKEQQKSIAGLQETVRGLQGEVQRLSPRAN